MKTILLIPLLLAGCAVPQRAHTPAEKRAEGFDRTKCNREAGYEAGYNDGRSGHEMNSDFAYPCRGDLRKDAKAGYQVGFKEGRKVWDKKAVPVNRPTPPPQKSLGSEFPNININIGGKQTIGGSRSQGRQRQNPKKYFCSTKAFMDTYEDFGPTRLEAEKKVRDLCQKDHHAMHCRKVKCQENR